MILKSLKNILSIVTAIIFLISVNTSFAQIEKLEKKLESTDANSIDAAEISFDIAKKYFESENFPKALQYSRRSLEIYRNADVLYDEAKVLQFQGDVYLAINDYNSAIENYLDAHSIFEELGESKALAENSLKMSTIYLNLGNFKKALNNLFFALEIFEKDKKSYKKELINTYTTIGSAYGYMEKTDSALNYFEKAFAITPSEDHFQRGILLNNIGAIHSKNNEFEKSLQTYTKALELVANGKNKKIKGVTLSNIAFLYKKQENDSASIRLYRMAMDTLILSGDLIYLKEVYDNLSDLYERNDDFESALKFHRQYLTVKDSIANEETINKIADIESKFEIAKLDKQIELIQRENELRTTRQYLIIGGLLLFIVVGFLIYRNLRINLKNEKLRESILEKEKQNLQNEINFKNKELENFALRVIQKNEFLEKLKEEIGSSKGNSDLKEISSNISKNLYIDKDKQELEIQIRNIQKSFFYKLSQRFPELTEYEKRLCSFIVLDLSLKDIAILTNISPESVKKSRYRLRQKLGLTTDDSLNDFLKNL